MTQRRRPSPRLRYLIRVAAVLLGIALVGGGVGFWLTGEYSFVEGLFQALIVVSTVGYSDLPPPSTVGGRIVYAVTVLIGVAGLFGVATAVVTEAIERMATQRQGGEGNVRAEDHYVVCGYGRIGRVVAGNLREAGWRVVVLDRDDQRVQAARRDGFDAVAGNAGDDAALEEASIGRARGLVSTFADDADNVFTVVSARHLGPEGLVTLATASSREAAEKLPRVGADHVVASEVAAGQMLARAATTPLAVELFLGSLAAGDFLEISVTEDSALAGMDLEELTERFPEVRVLAYRHAGHTELNPRPDSTAEAGMTLLVTGRNEDLREFREVAERSTDGR